MGETDPEDMSLSRLLAVAGHLVAMRWQRLMGSHGLTPHGLAVLSLLERGSALTQRELALHCGVAPSTLNHTVDHLERAGWIARRRGVADRRLVHMALTESGNRQLVLVQRAALSEMDPMLDHLDPAEEPIVRTFLLETVTRLQAQDPQTPLTYPPHPTD